MDDENANDESSDSDQEDLFDHDKDDEDSKINKDKGLDDNIINSLFNQKTLNKSKKGKNEVANVKANDFNDFDLINQDNKSNNNTFIQETNQQK